MRIWVICSVLSVLFNFALHQLLSIRNRNALPHSKKKSYSHWYWDYMKAREIWRKDYYSYFNNGLKSYLTYFCSIGMTWRSMCSRRLTRKINEIRSQTWHWALIQSRLQFFGSVHKEASKLCLFLAILRKEPKLRTSSVSCLFKVYALVASIVIGS